MASHCRSLSDSERGLVGFTVGELAALPYQVAGICRALQMRRGWIADEMGLGKTVQALGAIALSGSFPAVVVCPASLKINWRRETERWIPGRAVVVFDGHKHRQDPADVTIVNYDILHKRIGQLRGMRAVILDEAHCCKTPTTLRTRACLELASAATPDALVLLLTGTPLLNHTHELISQLGIIGRLQMFGGPMQFEARYCASIPIEVKTRWGNKTVKKYIGGKNLDELQHKLEPIVIRRRKADVLPELPPKRRATLWVDPDPDHWREYVKLEDLRDFGSLAVMRQHLGLAKVPACIEWIEECSEPLVVFVHHRSVGSALVEHFGCPAISGGMSAEDRQESVDRFQNGDARLIVCSIQAAGVGLTLTAASNVLFIEQAWTPALLEQAEDRCHRIGQQDSVTCWYAAVEGSLDEIVFKLLKRKAKTCEAVTPEEVWNELT